MRHKTSLKLFPLRKHSLLLHNRCKFSATQPRIENPKPLSSPSTLLYNNLLKICQQECKKLQSRHLFDELPQKAARASKACKSIHVQSLKHGIASKGHLGNAIVDLYAKCGDMVSAEKAFFVLENKDSMAWNSILLMYSRHGLLENVVEAFGSMWNIGVWPNQFSYAIVLSACARLADAELGKQVHCSVMKTGFEFDSFTEGSLIDMYAKCGYLIDARRIFDGVVEPDNVSWTAMISAYVKVGLPEKAMEVFEEMQERGCVPDQVASVTIINACVGLGRLDDARQLFSQMASPNVVAWNVMISGHAKGGKEVEAIQFFQDMIKASIRPTRSTLGSVLSAIASVANLSIGLQVHALAVKQGLESNVYVGSSLINMYAKCQKMEAASEVFNSLGEKNEVLWNALLAGYAQNGSACEVVKLFRNMRLSSFETDEYTYTSILSACACLEDMEMGQQLHSIIIKNKFGSNLFVGNALIDMYAKCGALGDARRQFEQMLTRDNISWNAIIVGYVQQEEEEEAFIMFQKMVLERVVPDEACLASVLSACANIQDLNKGKQVHSLLVKYGLESGLFAGSSLVDMYCKCGNVTSASEVFFCLPDRSVVSTNALISGYSQTNINYAVHLFQNMLVEGLRPSEVTFASILDACSGQVYMLGRQLHSFILKLGFSYDDEFLAISLIGMYYNSGRLEDARLLFSEFTKLKSPVLWTAMISGNIQNDFCEEALLGYQEMRKFNVMPDQATFASALKACSTLASMQDGRKLHSLIFHTGFDTDELTASSLIDMYAKCGDVKSSVQVFSEMASKKDVISWNSMIVGFAKNGFAEDALKIFEEMKRASVKADDITFLGVLTACSHAGMVSEGRQIFKDMTSHYDVRPRVDHCACMVDLLGRWGNLKEAEEFIERLDFEPDAMIWSAYLGACKIHGDDIRGQKAAEKLIELEPQNSSSYVLLSNIYASSGNWRGVNFLRKEMKEKGVRKPPGCSWIIVEQKTNMFVAGDKFHPCAGEIHVLLKVLTALMKDEGCFFDIGSVMDSDELESILSLSQE
ncbi:pentatricopeptide repeat-containing protein At3g09040, mitochondrial [Nicotiana tomentosiformis]|uniref:pentatricopeptide repeat-containing protein At3g09040, mitochondrial n=1 Tax=Nicotiana tomentosiformis TaxID=4098 RepID=UPI00051C591B|nr:pentatricopeptide repeat-containing protein At3g09040, mitochondrial [Nicotiana tomentosiformis]